jgi:DNA-binding NarL/FixJ family response regulator
MPGTAEAAFPAAFPQRLGDAERGALEACGAATRATNGARPGARAAAFRDLRPLALSDVWDELVHGVLHLSGSCTLGDRVYLAAPAPSASASAPLTTREADVMGRILCGERVKVVAVGLSLPPATVMHDCLTASHKLGGNTDPAPLPLVLAALSASGVRFACDARYTRFKHGGRIGTLLSIRRPDLRGVEGLGRAEQDVAALFLEGCSRVEIARQRRSSARTVADQIHAIYKALHVSGRYAVIRVAAARGCFGPAGTAPPDAP